MHDPDVVAFEIARPWPEVRRAARPPHARGIGWRAYWYVGPYELHWPPLVTVWHHEPGGQDCGTVCPISTWRRHPHHWRIQVPALQTLRRRLLTRCTWCSGPSRKRDAVNHARGWRDSTGPWWRGETRLYHSDCLAMETAHRTCLCDTPVLDHTDYGQCSTCNRFRAWRKTPTDLDRAMAAEPHGARRPQWITDELHRRHAARQTKGQRS